MNTNLRLVVDNTGAGGQLAAAAGSRDAAPAGPGTLTQIGGMLMVLGRFAATVSRAVLLPFVLLGAVARFGLRLARGFLRGVLGLVCLVFVAALLVVAFKAVSVMATGGGKGHGDQARATPATQSQGR